MAKKEHWARITDYRRVDLVEPMKARNNAEAFEKLMQWVEKIRSDKGCNQVMIVLEPSGRYWKPFG